MEGFSNIAFSPLLLSWLTKWCSSVWASTKQRMELAREGQLWLQRLCGSICELCCPDWRAQWNDAVNFGGSVYACKLVCTVLVRVDWGSVWGAWTSSPVMGHSFGPTVWMWQMSKEQWEVFAISSLQTVHVWVSSGTNSDFATSMFLCFRSDGRDVLPLVRGRRRAELLVECILPLRLRFSILEIFVS